MDDASCRTTIAIYRHETVQRWRQGDAIAAELKALGGAFPAFQACVASEFRSVLDALVAPKRAFHAAMNTRYR